MIGTSIYPYQICKSLSIFGSTLGIHPILVLGLQESTHKKTTINKAETVILRQERSTCCSVSKNKMHKNAHMSSPLPQLQMIK